jgi:hypothetical protein
MEGSGGGEERWGGGGGDRMQREIRARASEVAGGKREKTGEEKGWGWKGEASVFIDSETNTGKGFAGTVASITMHACMEPQPHTHMDEHMEMRIELGGWS